MAAPETVKLINNPKSPSLHLIQRFMQIHKQGQKYAVGDPMVGKTKGGGGSGSKTYKLTGRGKRKKVYAKNKEGAIVVGYLLLVKPGRDSFSYMIDGKSYRGYRERARGKRPRGTKYYNFIQEQ